MTNAMELATMKQIVDHASVQSDRWLFLALLAAFGWVIWFMIQRDEKRARHLAEKLEESNKAHLEALREYIARGIQREVEMASLQRGTKDALENNNRLIERIEVRLRDK